MDHASVRVFLCMLCARVWVCVSCRHGLSNHLPSVFLSVCQEKPSTSLSLSLWTANDGHTNTHTHTAHRNHLPLICNQWTITHKHVNTQSYILSDLDIELGAIYKSLTDLVDIQRLREVYVLLLWSHTPTPRAWEAWKALALTVKNWGYYNCING